MTSLTSLCLMLFLPTTFPGPNTDTSGFGQLTATEALIRQEIVRLGGDWESGTRPQLVGYLGPKFQSRHFEMLTHLPNVAFFAAHDTEFDGYGLSCISRIRNIGVIEIVRCRVSTGSLSILRANRQLTSLLVESALVRDDFFEDFSELVNLRTIDFVDMYIPDVLVDELAKMNWLKECGFTNCRGLSEDAMFRLKKALPHTEF